MDRKFISTINQFLIQFLSIITELLSNNKKGHLNQLSPIVSMETVTAVGVGGATSTELKGSYGSLCKYSRNDHNATAHNDQHEDGDDSPMILPAITKKIIVFDEEDELRALDSELDSRDDLDKLTPKPSPSLPRSSIDKSYLLPTNNVYDKTISSPLIEDREDDKLNHELKSESNVRASLGNGNTLKQSTSNNRVPSPKNQRLTSLESNGILHQSKSENGISQSLIERRNLLPVPKTTINGDHSIVANSHQSNSTSAIMINNKHEVH